MLHPARSVRRRRLPRRPPLLPSFPSSFFAQFNSHPPRTLIFFRSSVFPFDLQLSTLNSSLTHLSYTPCSRSSRMSALSLSLSPFFLALPYISRVSLLFVVFTHFDRGGRGPSTRIPSPERIDLQASHPQELTNCPFCNSFVFTLICVARGVGHFFCFAVSVMCATLLCGFGFPREDSSFQRLCASRRSLRLSVIFFGRFNSQLRPSRSGDFCGIGCQLSHRTQPMPCITVWL
jgi:hypothetical protein